MMDERERRDIMLRAIHRYGEAAQIDMAVEEMAELSDMAEAPVDYQAVSYTHLTLPTILRV